MADELDQQYMQTRQAMRQWQSQMFSMEPSVEGSTVHMGTQMGGKEQEGATAGPPAQAAEPVQAHAPETLAPNEFQVDTPEMQAVRQQGKEQVKPYVFDLDTFDVPGDVLRAGLAKLSGVERGEHEGELRMSSDEMVQRVFFQYGDKPEEVIKQAEALGMDEAQTLKVMAGLSAVVLGAVVDPLNVIPGGKGKDVAKVGKAVKDMSDAALAERLSQPYFSVLFKGADGKGTQRIGAYTREEAEKLAATSPNAEIQETVDVAAKVEGPPQIEDKSTILAEFKRAADILKSERGSVPLGGGGKPPEVPPPSAKQLATIDKRERAKADFEFKVEGFKAELTKQRRGPVLSDEAVRQLAGESGFTLQDLLNLKPGSILAPEIQVKAREVFKASAEKMRTSAKAYLAGGDPAAMDDFAVAFTEAGMATTRIIGTYAEGGRTFRLLNQKYPSLKKAGKPDGKEPEFSIQDQYIQQMYQFFKGAEEKSKMGGFAGTGGKAAQPGVISPGQLAQMVVDLPTEEAAMQFAAQALKPTWSDMFYEIWINGLLSGPVTHATNIISNAATIAWNIPERAVASMLHPQTVRPGEAAAMVGGVMESIGDAWRLAWKAFKEDQAQFGQSKLELPQRAITSDALTLTAIPGPAIDFLGTVVRMPGRFLMAGDDFFKAIAFRAELRALAKRQAFREINELGLTGKEAASKAKEIEHHILAEPPDSIKEAAQEFAAYTTFTRDLGEYGTKIQAAMNFPMGRVIVPFIRTPTNIFKFAGERTPLALASRAVREELAAGGERAALAQAKIALGSLTMGYMAMLAANGMITGGGPKDKALRRQWEDEGWQPYSFKVGKEYISFARIEPLGSLIGAAADAAEIIGQLDSMKDEQGQVKSAELASALTVAISRNIAQKTFVKGLAGTLNAVTSQDVNVVKSFLEKEVGSLVPGAVKTVTKTLDPVMRDVNDLIEVIQANTPGWSESLPAERNIWGQVKMARTAIGPDFISPIYNNQDKNDPIVKEMNRLNHAFTLPARNIDGVSLQHVPKVYWRYVELAANDKSLNKRTEMGSRSLHDAIAEVINGGQYKAAADGPQGGKIELIQKEINKYREAAKRALREENKDVDAALVKQVQYKETRHDATERAKMPAPQLR